MPTMKSVWTVVSRGCVGVVAALGLWSSGVSCGKFVRQEQAAGPRGQLLKDDELPLLMTRLGQYPKRFVTGADTVGVRFYFDPQLVDLTRVTGYSLWEIDGPTKTWRKIGTASPGALPLEIQPEEGLHGLRASVTYAGGTEKLVPKAGDEPSVWLAVDRSPPAITWIAPLPEASVRGARSLELKWSTNELQFGDGKADLEWSADRGRTWKPIAKVPLTYGTQSYTWRLPAELASDPLLRLKARDLAGHDAATVLALTYPGSVSSGEPKLAMDPPQAGGAPEPAATNVALVNPVDAGTSSTTAPAVAAVPVEDPPAVVVPPLLVGPPPVVDAPAPVATPAPGATPPAATAVARGAVEILDAPKGFRPAASPAIVRWRSVAPELTADVAVEMSVDGGSTWTLAGKVPVTEGKLEWTLPAVTVAQGLVRLTVEQPGVGPWSVPARETFRIDADAPRIGIVDLPEVAGARVEVAIELVDGGGSEVERIHAYWRQMGQRDWAELAANRVSLAGTTVVLELEAGTEDSYELWLRAVDKAGNSSLEPPTEALSLASVSAGAPGGRLRLDRTPPVISASPSPLEWVGGFAAEMLVNVDWTDGIPPLVLEGQDAGGGWKELGRWASVSPDQNRFSFLVPAGVEKYAIRFVVADIAGNKAHSTVGPQAVASPIRLEEFTEQRAYSARSSERISWKLHPVAAEVQEELTVSVDHQSRAGGDWTKIYDRLPVRGECYWDLPAADREVHRLRVRLSRQGKVLGESQSAPFTIEPVALASPTVVRISDESNSYSEQARSKADKVFAAAENGTLGAAELERLRGGVVFAYEKALELDSKNHKATYGMAQLLNRLDGDRSAAAVTAWLERTVEIKPDHLWALNDLGAAYIRDGKYDRAEAVLERSAAIEAKPVVLFNLGLALFFSQKYASARERFEAALKASKGEVPEGEIYYYLVQTHLLEGNAAAAQGLFRDKETTMPEDMRAEVAKAFRG